MTNQFQCMNICLLDRKCLGATRQLGLGKIGRDGGLGKEGRDGLHKVEMDYARHRKGLGKVDRDGIGKVCRDGEVHTIGRDG